MAIRTIVNKHVDAIVHTDDDIVLQVLTGNGRAWVPFTNEDMFTLMKFWWHSLTPELRRHYYDRMLLPGYEW